MSEALANYLLLSLPDSVSSRESIYNFLTVSLNEEKSPVFEFNIPDFKIGTLDSLVQESDELSKIDTQLQGSINKLIDILGTIYPDNPGLVNAYKVVGDKHVVDYLQNFSWNTSKYRLDKSIKDLIEIISSEAITLDSDVRAAYTNYNTAKSNLVAADRKKTGDLSVKSLHEIVQPNDFVLNSDNLKTLLIAVPKNLSKDFLGSYETLTQMVVPRSASVIAEDSEYYLYNVTLFKKFANEFINSARERKWTPREFNYSEESLNEMRKEFDLAKSAEVRLKNELVGLTKTAYSDITQSLIHIKSLRVYVESVLRYGLPPVFYSYLVGVTSKNVSKVKDELIQKYGYLGGSAFSVDKKGRVKQDASLHEYASLVDTDYEPFVLYEVELA